MLSPQVLQPAEENKGDPPSALSMLTDRLRALHAQLGDMLTEAEALQKGGSP